MGGCARSFHCDVRRLSGLRRKYDDVRGKGFFGQARRERRAYPEVDPAACVDSAITARCGDAPVSPPWPQPKSLAAGPHAILKQALSHRVCIKERSINSLRRREEYWVKANDVCVGCWHKPAHQRGPQPQSPPGKLVCSAWRTDDGPWAGGGKPEDARSRPPFNVARGVMPGPNTYSALLPPHPSPLPVGEGVRSRAARDGSQALWAAWSPLPKGEGQGEGKQDTGLPRLCSLPKSVSRNLCNSALSQSFSVISAASCSNPIREIRQIRVSPSLRSMRSLRSNPNPCSPVFIRG